jgi:hypothetical protein
MHFASDLDRYQDHGQRADLAPRRTTRVEG